MFKKVLSVVLSLIMVIGFSSQAFAAEMKKEINEDRAYVIINGIYKVYEGENWESPATGEYFYWTGTRGVDKSFTFNIRYSVQSSEFTINGTQVIVTADAEVRDDNGYYLKGFKGHLYSVSIDGWYSRWLQFSVGRKQSGTISGLKKGGKYKVTIMNNDYLEYGQNLVGSGTIES